MEAWSEDLNPVEKSVTQRLHAQICRGHAVPPALAWSLHKDIRSHNYRLSWFWRDTQDISLGSGNHTPKGVLKSKKWENIISGEALSLDQVPPDLCSLQARWYQVRFMTSGTRSGDWDWWGGLAKTWRWALADEWECVRKITRGKIGVAKCAQQPGQNSTKKLTHQKKRSKRVKILYFCFSKNEVLGLWAACLLWEVELTVKKKRQGVKYRGNKRNHWTWWGTKHFKLT